MNNTSPDSGSRLTSIMGRLCAVLGSDALSTGERACLRRMQPGQPPPLQFYRFALHHLPEHWEASEDDWITLVAGIALLVPHACRPGQGLGRVLGESGFSESRLERLLQSTGQTRRILLLRAARFLAARSAPFDWSDAARLLLTRDPDKRKHIHRKVAQDFYHALDSQPTSA